MTAPLDVRILPAASLTTADWEHWERTLDETPSLHSPFLRPGFVRAVASVRDDLRVAVWEGDCGLSFLPFHAARGGADAAGLGLSEWQAAVTRGEVPWRQLLAACRWRCFRYDHLCSAQAPRDQHCRRGASPWMNLQGGYQAYLSRRREIGGRLLSETERKARKLAREVGGLEFQIDADREQAMSLLLSWKRLQHQRTGVPDAFQVAWIVGLLEAVSRCHEPSFRGRISVLRAGGRPVAVHLGVESRGAAHVWYPAYDPQLAAYSPGIIMWLRLAEAMAAEGAWRLDFGPGGQRYKDRLKTDDDEVALGAVDATWLAAAARRQWGLIRAGLRSAKSRLFSAGNRPALATPPNAAQS